MIIFYLEVMKDQEEFISHLKEKGRSRQRGTECVKAQRCETTLYVGEITVLYYWSVTLE